MQLIVGLGNPGEQYNKTRHNVGFEIIDALAKRLELTFSENKKVHGLLAHKDELYLLKPLTFMNNSGEAVRATFEYFAKDQALESRLEQLFVIHDDLDIPLGSYKIQKGKGPKSHNGLLSIYEQLGSQDFYHIRVGVENRGVDRHQFPGHQYVLASFSEAEKELFQATISKIELELFNLLGIR